MILSSCCIILRGEEMGTHRGMAVSTLMFDWFDGARKGGKAFDVDEDTYFKYV